ncbi:ABC transporter permease [Oerskovia enterophila]|uniref:Dipeptide transport system permease protein DppC n=1 Tax=Oerskovia enterophila TaxID=43678 RepID=A0ABX2Y3F5_9CELL|nr:ABC transporter permease [Oerskovia enterophila]OCI30832.1 dipeptide transport system permease protein DppC [Oerskovia enterophila]
MTDDDIRTQEFVTPATSASPAADVVVDGIAPDDRTAGRVPDVPAPGDGAPEVEPGVAVVGTTKARKGPLEMLPRRSGKLVAGLVLTLGIIAFAFIAPFFTQDPRNVDAPANLPPSLDHLLGTNNLGADIFAQLAAGAASSLIVGMVAGAIAVVLSLFFGIVAGYVGGWTDEALYLFTNVMLVIPGLPLVIVIASYMESRSMWIIAVVLGVTSWAGSAIVLRTQAKSLRNRDYVAASRVAGERPLRIITVEILPNLLPLLAAQFLFAVVLAILGEAGLSYLGLGPSGSITWGSMLNESFQYNAFQTGQWWWYVPPGLLISLFGCGLSLINFSIDEIINPKLRTAPAAVKSIRKARKLQARGAGQGAGDPSELVGDDGTTTEKETVNA